jgi:signal transduction histidine kinase
MDRVGGTTAGPNPDAPVRGPSRNNFKILLLIGASALVLGMLLYSQRIIDQLTNKQRDVITLYANSIRYISNPNTAAGDFTFVFDEVIRAIDFPIILTDAKDRPLYTKNLIVGDLRNNRDSTAFFTRTLADMDSHNEPIRIALNDTLVLNYVHYGESDLIRQLRWLPYFEIALAAIFVFIAYLGFSYIKRSEQSNIWVGMAKETAHQLGTPLSSILGWLEMARSEALSNPKLEATLQEMTSDVERLSKITARFSKIGSKPDLKEENLTEVIQGVITYISKRLPRSGRTVDIAIDTPGPFRALINRELFEWVMENLMKNALDAMEGPTGKISFSLSQSGQRTLIDVTDTGRGIDQKLHKEIFRPGYSTKKRGWGLGLSLSKRIIEDYHKGKLYVKESAAGVGTTFRIRLGRS